MRYGRIQILTDLVPSGNIDYDRQIIPQILDLAYKAHLKNTTAMRKLVEYYYNRTEIRNKTKVSRQDINYKISVPRADTTVTTINSYCFSNPFKFISLQAEEDINNELKAFNDCCELDNYTAKLIECAEWSGITGLGYKYVQKPSDIDLLNGKFFKSTGDIDPLTTFCVYSNTIDKEKVMAVTYRDVKLNYTLNGQEVSEKYIEFNVFTKWHVWTFRYDGKDYVVVPFKIRFRELDNLSEVAAYPYSFTVDSNNNLIPKQQTIPIIEYLRKPNRTNDFEKALLLMDAVDVIVSNCVDCVAQNVDYIFKFKDVDIGEWDENGRNPTMEIIKTALKEHILRVNSVEGAQNQPDVDILEVPLNQTQVTQLLEWLNRQIEESLFVPNRNGSSGGADTNSSVETRNGFRSLEDIAGIITSQAIKSEKEFIQCALEIGQQYPDCPFKNLKLKDIGIKPMRNKIESLINSTQAFATMINSGVNRTTAYVVSGLVADATDTVAMDRLERDERFQESVRQEIERIKAKEKAKPNQEQTPATNQEEIDSNNE